MSQFDKRSATMPKSTCRGCTMTIYDSSVFIKDEFRAETGGGGGGGDQFIVPELAAC